MGGPAASAGACPSCGEPVGPRTVSASRAGRNLAAAAVSSGQPGDAPSCPSCPSGRISADGYCEECGCRVPSGRDHEELDLGLLAGVTDRGLRHHRNEDAMALATAETPGGPAALAVVCDGISTSDRPDEASLAAAQAAIRVLLSAARSDEDLAEASSKAVNPRREAVASLAGSSEGWASAATIRLRGDDEQSGHGVLAW